MVTNVKVELNKDQLRLLAKLVGRTGVARRKDVVGFLHTRLFNELSENEGKTWPSRKPKPKEASQADQS